MEHTMALEGEVISERLMKQGQVEDIKGGWSQTDGGGATCVPEH